MKTLKTFVTAKEAEAIKTAAKKKGESFSKFLKNAAMFWIAYTKTGASRE
jgi:hypothetical protein